MNKKIGLNFKKLIKVIAFMFFLYLIGLKYITSHEFIHQQIFNKYDIDSKSNWDYTLNGYTIPLGNFENCNDNCKSLNIWNDIVGYYFSIFCLFIFVLYMFRK